LSQGAARNYDWSQTKRFLDVAGGSGCFAIAIAQKYPSIHCTVAELPAVVPITKEYITKFKGFYLAHLFILFIVSVVFL
jgi:acetylserotonin N-methyltransferase